MRKILCVLSLMLSSYSISDAASVETQRSTLDITQRDGDVGTIRLSSDKKSVATPLESEPVILLGGNDLVIVRVVDPNPLLFHYKSSEIVKTPTKNAEALKKLAEALVPVIKGYEARVKEHEQAVKGTPAAKPPPEFKIGDIDCYAFLKHVRKLYTWEREIGPLISKSISLPTDVQRDVKGWDVKKTADKARANAMALEEVRYTFLMEDSVFVRIDGQKPKMAKSVAEVRRLMNGREDEALLNKTLDFVWDLRYQGEEISALAHTIRSFVETVARMNKPVELASVHFDRENVQTFETQITANPEFSPYFTKTVTAYQTKRTGNYKLVFKPKQRFLLRAAPGAVYSFVRNPSFSAVPANSHFVIEREQGEFSAVGGAIAVNFAYTALMNEIIAPFLQLGMAASSKQLAFLVGVGLGAPNRLVISGGWIYQQITALDGQEEGQSLESPAELKTKKDFKSGFYLMLGTEF